MPKYINQNNDSVIDAIPESLPAAYGSAYDTRAGEIEQLRPIAKAPDVSADEINNAIASAFNPDEFSELKPAYQVHSFNIDVDTVNSTALSFKAKSIRIDNFTNQWLYVPVINRFIPPNWYGAVFMVNGVDQITVLFAPPGSIVQPAPTAGTIVNVVAFFQRLPDVAGNRIP